MRELDLTDLLDHFEEVELDHPFEVLGEVEILVLLEGISVGEGLSQLEVAVIIDLEHLVVAEEDLRVGVEVVFAPVECHPIRHPVQTRVYLLLMLSIYQSVVEPVAVVDLSDHLEAGDVLLLQSTRLQVTTPHIPLVEIPGLVECEEAVTEFAVAEVEAALAHAHKLDAVTVHERHLHDLEVADLQTEHRVELVIVDLVDEIVLRDAIRRLHELGQRLPRVRLLDRGWPINRRLVLERRVDHVELCTSEKSCARLVRVCLLLD